MTWTTDKPTVPGWYWYQPQEATALIVFVTPDLQIEQGAWHVSEINGEWAGPLEPPREERG